MKKLSVPSLQHLARNWCDDPDEVRRRLVRLHKNAPPFNYSLITKLVGDMLVYEQPYDSLIECIRRRESRQNIQKNHLEVFELVHEHFKNVKVTFVKQVTGRYYPISRDYKVPFNPPLLYGTQGQIIFPWFSFWKDNPLDQERLSLFVTVVYEMLLQDPELENARFQILDFSAPKGSNRLLRVIDADQIPRLTKARRNEMIDIFADGFLRATKDIEDINLHAKGAVPRELSFVEGQSELFDELLSDDNEMV